MKSNYNNVFNTEIERILKELYYNPSLPNGNDKRKIINTERKYIQFLIENMLVRELTIGVKGYSLILERRGYEVFEKYGSWLNYKKKVIDKKNKIEEAKGLAQRFWWIPIVISCLAIVVAILALIKK